MMGAQNTDVDAPNYDPAAQNNETVHQVTLTKDYYMAEKEVTQALWKAVMGEDQTPTSNYLKMWSVYNGKGDRPAYFFSWDESQAFIQKLNQLTGQTFRLPTEAEWEYAARGGNKSRGSIYSGSHTLDSVAWYEESVYSKGDPQFGCQSVATTQAANELGLYDMSGNVFEWCYDWYANFDSADVIDPKGPETGTVRVFRGGSWYYDESYNRVSSRFGNAPDNGHGSLGLRLAM